MKSWKKALGYGFAMWLIPFIVAVAIFAFHDSNRPLFESIMAVTVAGTAALLGLRYLTAIVASNETQNDSKNESLRVGLLWFGMALLIDAPMMLLGGPMQMSVGEYVSDIGITYVCIPVILWTLGRALSREP